MKEKKDLKGKKEKKEARLKKRIDEIRRIIYLIYRKITLKFKVELKNYDYFTQNLNLYNF